MRSLFSGLHNLRGPRWGRVGSILLVLVLGVVLPTPAETLLAAGATFPEPLYQKLFELFSQQSGHRVHYQGMGSGFGVRALLEKRVDIGATDAFIADRVLQEAEAEILHVPTCVGAVTLTYNLPGVAELRLAPDQLAGLFLGDITRWDDPRIAKTNPSVVLPSIPVIIVHRQDASGTTFIFSDYLSQTSRQWAFEIGRGTTLSWPVGYGAERNSGVASVVGRAKGALGYVEHTHAENKRLPTALVMNRSGRFIKPDIHSVSLAANVSVPSDTRISITNTTAPNGYPIASFSWLIVFREQRYNDRGRERAESLTHLLAWIVGEGQRVNPHIQYSPLPQSVQRIALKVVQSILYDGEVILGQ